jgi:hypothetical protein
LAILFLLLCIAFFEIKQALSDFNKPFADKRFVNLLQSSRYCEAEAMDFRKGAVAISSFLCNSRKPQFPRHCEAEAMDLRKGAMAICSFLCTENLIHLLIPLDLKKS